MTAKPRPPLRAVEVAEVADGILRLSFPLPFALDHINLWALRDGAGWMLVDSGIADAHGRAEWRRLLADELAGRPVTRILVTHHHPDHFGLAGWLAAETGAPVLMAAGEIGHARWLLSVDDAAADAGVRRWYLENGIAPAIADRVAGRGNDYARRMGPLPAHVELLAPGETVTVDGVAWHLLLGEGHSPEHLSLWCPSRALLIAGDQVLPRISPNVSAYWWEAGRDPLTGFLASIERFAALPAETTVLPSHGPLFQTLPQRLAELAAHHAARLAETRAALEERPLQAAGILPLLFRRPLDDHQVFFALGEAAAHLNCLVTRGQARREAGAAGVWYRLA